MTQQRGPSGEEGVKEGASLQELAGGVVHGVYRVVKACQFHADVANDAVTSLTGAAANAVVEYCARAATETVALSFLGDAIFVNRQILKSSRDTHALAAELRDLLATCEVTEVTLSRTVDRAGISAFAKLLADVQRDRSLIPRIVSGEIPGIVAGKARFAASGAAREESPGQRAARTYATAVLTVQAVLADVRARKFELPRRIKRVAQQMVARADEDARLLVALAATGGVSLDTATIAVGSAILSVAMTRQLTTDRAVLANAAMTALLYDAGRYVMSGGQAAPGMPAAQRVLNDDELDKVPTRTVLALTALGRMHAPARARTTLLYEVWSMRRAHRAGPVYGGRRPPTLLARIIGVARAFAELRAAGASGGLSIDDALQVLGNRAGDGTERALVKLLIGSLGIYPAGTMVTLNTGELGVVMGTPAMPLDYVRPPVKILYDEHANLLETPIDVDLANPPPGEPPRFIWKSVDADEQQMKAMRAFVVAATAAKRRGALAPEDDPAPRSAHARVEANQDRPPADAPAQRLTAPAAEPTLQSAVEELAARRAERQPQVVEATPPAARVANPERAPPSSAKGASADAKPSSSRRVPIIVVPPPPSSLRRPAPTEPTPPSAQVAPVAPVRRRDPRNDSDPPSSMQDDVLGPVRAARPARAPPVVAPAPIATPAPSPAPSPAAALAPSARHDTETVRPPSSANPLAGGDGGAGAGDGEGEHVHSDSTRQMTWEAYGALLNPNKAPPPAPAPADDVNPNSKATAPPPPSARMPLDSNDEEPPPSKHDDLLAAFLADAPIDTATEPPPPEPEPSAAPSRHEKVTIKRDPKG